AMVRRRSRFIVVVSTFALGAFPLAVFACGARSELWETEDREAGSSVDVEAGRGEVALSDDDGHSSDSPSATDASSDHADDASDAHVDAEIDCDGGERICCAKGCVCAFGCPFVPCVES